MGYYHIKLDPETSQMRCIIPLWRKCVHQRLSTGIAGAPAVFQAKTKGSSLMMWNEFKQPGRFATISTNTFEDHLAKLREDPKRMQEKGLRVNAAESDFGASTIDFGVRSIEARH